jgi:prepilin-type processing-associated H-X9-DG protein
MGMYLDPGDNLQERGDDVRYALGYQASSLACTNCYNTGQHPRPGHPEDDLSLGNLTPYHCTASAGQLSTVCDEAGIQAADDVSYVYTGGASISSTEHGAAMRIAADNEQEGDEAGCAGHPAAAAPLNETSFLQGEGANYAGLWPVQNYTIGDPFNDERNIYDVRYHYVGGLEDLDNHGRDGVNVLYLDWHASFDGRNWPAPIGGGGGDFTKYRWDSAGADATGDGTSSGHPCIGNYDNSNVTLY